MTPTQSRISLSIGRASDGPRTVSDLNLAAFSLVIYVLWFFLTVFSAAGVFGPTDLVADGDLLGELPYPALSIDMMGWDFFNLQSPHVHVFLGVSAISLIVFGLIAKRRRSFKLHRWYLVAAGLLGCAGVVLQMAFPPDLAIAMIVGGAIEGFSASIFIFLWGAIYSRFEFATSIINAALAFAVGIILAISLVNWIPSQATAVIDAILPLAAIPLLIRVVPTLGDAGLGQELDYKGNYKVAGYVIRMMLSLLLLGILIGSLCVLCGAFLLTSGDLATELVMVGGCIVSCAVFVWAIAISRKETRWDSLFRYISPIIALAFCMLPLVFTDAIYIAAFLLALACICIQSLTWVFLCSNARNLTAVPMASFAFGFALIQVGLIIGSIICKSVIGDSLYAVLTEDSIIYADVLGVQMQSMVLALVLTALLFLTYSMLPRYRELKTIMSSMLKPLESARAIGTAMPSPSDKADEAKLEHAFGMSQDYAADGHSATSHSASEEHSDLGSHGSPAYGDPDVRSRTVAYAIMGDGLEPGQAPSGDNGQHADANAAGSPGDHSGLDPIAATADVAMAPNSHQGAPEPIEGSAVAAEATPTQDAPGATAASSRDQIDEGPSSPKADASGKGSFKRRCDEIARMYLLSEREKEVMFLLAKGHNAAYILDQLCISRSTVKTHINHIYKKLDIHTQQELLNMVEERHRGPARQPVEHDLLVEAAKRLAAEGPVNASPSRLVQEIDLDVHSQMMQR